MKRGAALIVVALALLPAVPAQACPTLVGIRLSDCDDDDKKPRKKAKQRGSASASSAAESALLHDLNTARARAGAGPVGSHSAARDIARAHAKTMAKYGSSFHNDGLKTSGTRARLGYPRWLAENVGHGPSAESIQLAFERSAEHRHNMLNGVYDAVGIGVVKDGRYLYAVEVFVGGARGATWSGGGGSARGGRGRTWGRTVDMTVALERMLPGIPERIDPAIAPVGAAGASLPWQIVSLGLAGFMVPVARKLRRR